MDEDSRRSLHQLVMRAADKDAQATAAIEEMIMGLDRSGSADDVAQSLQILTIGGDELHNRIVTLLQENDRQRRHWPIIAQP